MDLILSVILLILGICVIGAVLFIPEMSYKKAIIKSFPEAQKGYRLIHVSTNVYDYLYIDNKVYSVIFSHFPYKIVFVKELCKKDLPTMEDEVCNQLYRNFIRKNLK